MNLAIIINIIKSFISSLLRPHVNLESCDKIKLSNLLLPQSGHVLSWPSTTTPRSSRAPEYLLFFFFTLVTDPRRSLRLKLSDTRVYAPQIRARLGTTASEYIYIYIFCLLVESVRTVLRSKHLLLYQKSVRWTPWEIKSVVCWDCRGTLLIRNSPPPWHIPTVGSQGGAVSYE